MSWAPREHGTYVMRKRGECRTDPCDACREAGNRYERRRLKLRALDRPAYIDPARTVRHVRRLLAAGLTVHELEKRSGVHRTAIRVMLGDFPGRPASKRIRARTAAALLAVTAEHGATPAGATVDGTGTRRRLRALMANGWPAGELADRLGAGTPWLQVARRDRVRGATAIVVRALYDELADTPGPSHRAATYWRGRGYLTPAWWDDDTIDDPTAEPDGLREYGGFDGRLFDDRSAWRLDRVDRLYHVARWTPDRIAEQLGVPKRYVLRDLRQLREVAS